jgi:type II secretory pathway component PulF
MALLEPAVIIFMGVIVGFVAVAMVQSIYGMVQGNKIK